MPRQHDPTDCETVERKTASAKSIRNGGGGLSSFPIDRGRRRAPWLPAAALAIATVVAASLGQPALAGDSGHPLRFGVLPFASPAQLVGQFRHLRQYLQRELGRPVVLQSAPDFATFAARTIDGQYDLVFTPPHFAALAIGDSGYQPVAKVHRQVQPTLFVRRDSDVTDLSDLRDRTIAAPESLALVTVTAELALARHGLPTDGVITILHTPSHNNALTMVAQGLADAAVSSDLVFDRLPTNLRTQLKALRQLGDSFNMIYIAHPCLSAASVENLSALMRSFPKAPEAALFGRDVEFDMIEAGELLAFDHLIPRVRIGLAGHDD